MIQSHDSMQKKNSDIFNIIHDKNSQEIEMKGNLLALIKDNYRKHTDNTDAFLCSSDFYSIFYIQIILASIVKSAKEIKNIQIGKEVKLNLYADGMIVYVKVPRNLRDKNLKPPRLK